MPTTGRQAEAHVARLLVAEGWAILAANARAEGGELDLVVERAGVVRFVEVKARTEEDQLGIYAIDARKRAHLRAAAEGWLAAHGPPEREVAFLVALVDLRAPDWAVEWWDDPF